MIVGVSYTEDGQNKQFPDEIKRHTSVTKVSLQFGGYRPDFDQQVDERTGNRCCKSAFLVLEHPEELRLSSPTVNIILRFTTCCKEGPTCPAASKIHTSFSLLLTNIRE